MPRGPPEAHYQKIDDEISVIQVAPASNVPLKDLPVTPVDGPVHAVPINSSTDFTIITGETPIETRKYFISRVYSILWLQLAVTSGFLGCCSQIKPLQTFMTSNVGFTLLWMSAVITLSMTCCLFCLRNSLKRCPGNCIYLSLFTMLMSYMIG